MVDRVVKLNVLDALRESNFRTAEQISKAKGLDLETVKQALLELRRDKSVVPIVEE